MSLAILSAIEIPQPQIIWNVGTGKGHKIIEILEMILQKSNFENPVINPLENYSSDVNTNILSIDQITSESDWFPRINIQEGVQKTIDNRLKFEKELSQKF